MNVQERFLKYVSYWTTSDEDNEQIPSSARQFELAKVLEAELKEKVYQIEDYFIEHNSSLQVRTIEIINNVRIDILVAHHGTATFAVFGGLITSAKADPEDEFIPEVGEAIAIQRLVNKILELNYGAKF